MAGSHPFPLPSLHGGEESSFLDNVPHDDMVNSESVVGIKPGNSGVMIGYQVDEFIGTWSGECFIVESPTDPGFTGIVS